MVCKPRRLRGFLAGMGLVAGIVVLDALLIRWITRKPVDLLTFILGLIVAFSLPALVLMAYWLYSLVGMRYTLDRNGLVITCGATKQTVPMNSIRQVIPGAGHVLEGRMHGVRWPGYWLGHGHLAGIDPVLRHRSPGRATFIGHSHIDLCHLPGRRESVHPGARNSPPVGHPPTLVTGITAGQICHLAYLERPRGSRPPRPGPAAKRRALRLPVLALSESAVHCTAAPLHFDAAGAVDRSGARSSLFILPLIGLLIWGGNGALGLLLRAREYVAAYLLWSGTLLVQVLLIVVMFALLR